MKAFVYCWTDHKTTKLYVGWHKGLEEDGYIASSQSFLNEYNQRPSDFTRQIIAHGEPIEMQRLEQSILEAADAARDVSFYNLHNGGKNFVCLRHTEATRNKMKQTWLSKDKFNCDSDKAHAAWRGSRHTEDAKQRMKIGQKKHSKARSTKMANNNPMKNPESIAKMLATRKKNKEQKLV